MMSVSSKPYSDPARWVCLYPIYINSTKKLEEGRRIPKSKAVADPTAQEIFDILQHAGCKCEIKADVMHPRDPNREPVARGRVRVQLKNDDGSLCDSKFKSRKDLMLYVADLIPKLKSRQVDAAAPGPSQPTTTGGKKKKR
ncbi:SRP19 protein [Aphelenchoides besseyi]|nr:SRP19 protein [Aphelenchoides besseyi]